MRDQLNNDCRYVYKYIGPKGLAAMIAVKWSSGESEEKHADKKVCKREIHPAFQTQGTHYQRSKTAVFVAPQKVHMSSKN